jgi:hypothetical protein
VSDGSAIYFKFSCPFFIMWMEILSAGNTGYSTLCFTAGIRAGRGSQEAAQGKKSGPAQQFDSDYFFS